MGSKMNRQDTLGTQTFSTEVSSIEGIVQTIEEQFRIVMGKPARVAESCVQLKLLLPRLPDAAQIENLQPLLALLTRRTGPLVIPLFDLLEEIAFTPPKPPLINAMIAAFDKSLAHRALRMISELAQRGDLSVDHKLICTLADEADTSGKPLSEPDLLSLIENILRHGKSNFCSANTDPVLALLLQDTNPKIKRLAARILDKYGEPAPSETAEKILGREANEFLAPYLAYTRASYSDLLSLLPLPGKPPPWLPQLRQAHAALGQILLREVIAEVGWARLNLGLEIKRYVQMSIGDSIPLLLHPAEAVLFEHCGGTHRISDMFLIITHGTAPLEDQSVEEAKDPASLFRLYNLNHAELLSDFLAVAPLTIEKVHSILARMDRIVEEFESLFSSFSEECSILPNIYRQLKEKIKAGLDAYSGCGPLSADLTRIVMMFEDPLSLSEVQTVHGLKRYLHQKGLQLGFRLVLRSRSTNRSVDLLLASPERILEQNFKGIRYSDFEPESEGDQPVTHIPYSVRIVIEGFARQLLYGQATFPRTDIFCYGTEVHYYLSFRNHPAFLRINFAPPLQGGMIDLEYYGVSKYELSVHPDLSLFALKRFFQYLEFDIDIVDTRVHARYDKEHAHDLESLCHKAEGIFRLAPYLLEVDWTIGGLKLDADARIKVAEAWAVAFAHWGILPLRYMLTDDRTGIVESIQYTPSGKKEIVWDGQDAYRDRLIIHPQKNFYEALCAEVDKLDIDVTLARAEDGHRRFGQIRLERWLLMNLRKAVDRGELSESPEGYRRIHPDRFQRVHESEYFAEIIHSNDSRLRSAAILPGFLTPLERTLNFRTTGTVNSHEIQFARLPLRGDEIGIFVMRGENNNIRLACYTHGTTLFKRRDDPSGEWQFNGSCDVSEFIAILRRANYPVANIGPGQDLSDADIQKIRLRLIETPLSDPMKFIPGEHRITGLSASPGRTVGRVLFEVTGRKPEDFDGRVLVAAAVRPEDNAYLYHAAGIVSTGGGILSHTGLLATQFNKPAIIISGRWEMWKNHTPLLRYLNMEYELHETVLFGYGVGRRRRIREREHMLREGDLVVLDATEGWLRVLGQDHDTLALHEALHEFGKASFSLSQLTADQDLLTLRGSRLRARHHIEKILTRLTQPILACHAVYELILDPIVANLQVSGSEKAYLLQVIMNNMNVGDAARNYLEGIAGEINQRFQSCLIKAENNIPVSSTVYEVLHARLDVCRAKESLNQVAACLQDCGITGMMPDESRVTAIDRLAKRQLIKLRATFANDLRSTHDTRAEFRTRHILRDMDRIDLLIGTQAKERKPFLKLHQELHMKDEASRATFKSRNIIFPGHGGLELYPFVGWKAANLGEIGKIVRNEWVPPWFAVTHRAFQNILEAPIDQIVYADTEIPDHASSLHQAIESILKQPKLDNIQKSHRIRNLWDAVILPEKLSEEITTAYKNLSAEITPVEGSHRSAEAYVAIRSSSCEEDSEVAAWAGEFETFLYVRGEKAVLDYLKRTWSGLWSERAIHNRALLGSAKAVTGGGVIVQRIVSSRVSGVIQTINVGRNEMREMVINAGLGMGEGIVSGIVAADHIVVAKENDTKKAPLQFTYVTADKKDYTIFNKRAGFGTIRCQAPYHKRLRPALEYVELCELVAKALYLESSYGYPLDIEFGIEGTRIWILQTRPVPVFLPAVQETLEKFPIIGKNGSQAAQRSVSK
ncbi:hypothetical protein JNL27_12565 [bacterium]|nr:hypothetical protein [bacterium]